MILVIDNYDSFTYNLVQYLGELGADPLVKRNDEISVNEAAALGPAAIVISPGPGTPQQAGISMEVVRSLGDRVPVLGVCLGHQAIAEVFGGKVVRARELMHGKTSRVIHGGRGLFEGIESPIEVMRYHSLTVDPGRVPDELEITAWGEDDPTEIHALQHRRQRVWGVQFHPESVMTKSGKRILGNFLRLAAGTAILVSALGALPASAQNPEPMSEPLDTGYVIYDNKPVSLPLGIGLRIPGYNRVDGLVLPWGPDVKLAGGKIKLSPTVTYRTHIGEIDPELTGKVEFTAVDVLELRLGRSTFTNDEWIRSDIMNSLAAIGVGTDARNYFRADRITAEFLHSFVQPTTNITPSIGFLHEYAWSTGRPDPHESAPWSVFGKKDTLKMRRINPAIDEGHTTSGLAGLRIDFDDNATKARVATRVEHGFDAPSRGPGANEETFTQYTVDARAEFPTFGAQSFEFRGHGVFTGGEAPRQRFVYLGGGGTLSTVDLLAFGGDRLVYVEGEYKYPLNRPMIQFVGPPVLSLRYAAGSAGIDELPDFIQNVSAGISLKVIKVEYHFDPSYNETPFNKKSAFSVSFSLPF